MLGSLFLSTITEPGGISVISTIVEKGATIGIICYFVWRDVRFMNALEESLAKLQKTVDMVFNNNKEE